ncbi:hypothetical protein ACFV2N_26160 [Streptomyces sp. NPDC059680]
MTTPPQPPAPGPPSAPPPGTATPPDALIECPHCKWLGPADSVYCGGDCGRRLREPAS